MIGSLFILFFYQMYKNRNSGGLKGTGMKGKTGAGKEEKKSNWLGGG